MNRLLLTRARPQAEAFAADMRGRTGLVPLLSPMLEMQDIPVKIGLEGIAALAFTSRNGVSAFVRRSDHRLPAYCVGEATADLARQHGFETITAAGNIAALLEILPPTGVLHLHGKHVTGSLGQQALAIYDQVARPLSSEAEMALRGGNIAAVALFSPRSAQLFAESYQESWPVPPVIYALSPMVAAALPEGYSCRICPAPRAADMLRLLFADYPA
ncbi:MAG: uroporphyrinogen-III synthase [Rhodobacteraceae bacterium]|nr:uroporphyrinogen-III synthase [Paracoccaceae bacterium]